MNMPMNYQFNAMQYEPAGDFEAIPAGKYSAVISKAEVKALKDNKPGARYAVEFTVLEGTFRGRKVFGNFNLWNQNPQSADIAHKQLSGLCRAIGVLNIDFSRGGQEIVNARCIINVGVKDDNNEVKGYAPLAAGAAPLPPAPPMAPGVPAAPAAPPGWMPQQAPMAPLPMPQQPMPQQWQQQAPMAPPPAPHAVYQPPMGQAVPPASPMPPAPPAGPSTAGQSAAPWSQH